MTFNEINIIMPNDETSKDLAQRNLIYMHYQLVAAAKTTLVDYEIDEIIKVDAMICDNIIH